MDELFEMLKEFVKRNGISESGEKTLILLLKSAHVEGKKDAVAECQKIILGA